MVEYLSAVVWVSISLLVVGGILFLSTLPRWSGWFSFITLISLFFTLSGLVLILAELALGVFFSLENGYWAFEMGVLTGSCTLVLAMFDKRVESRIVGVFLIVILLLVAYV
jgi:hypothetical protein